MSFANPVESVNKEELHQETPSNASSTCIKMCSHVELAGRRRVQKYAWLDDDGDEEEDENVSSGQKLMVAGFGRTEDDEGRREDRNGLANTSVIKREVKSAQLS